MGSKRLRVLPAEVCRAREQFDRWRANKQERERIPPRLWVVAGGLCETYSTRRVARWLRLNHKSLQGQLGRRCDRRPSPIDYRTGKSSKAGRRSQPARTPA